VWDVVNHNPSAVIHLVPPSLGVGCGQPQSQCSDPLSATLPGCGMWSTTIPVQWSTWCQPPWVWDVVNRNPSAVIHLVPPSLGVGCGQPQSQCSDPLGATLPGCGMWSTAIPVQWSTWCQTHWMWSTI